MDGRRASAVLLLTAVLWLLPRVPLTSAQDDPLTLQKRAIARIDAFIDQYRKTGDMQTRRRDLAQADAELAASNRMLAARSDWSALALGLIKQGHVYRMQGEWQNAIPFYRQAEEAAKRARDLVRQSDALAWRALAESSQRNAGQALADASEAVRLAETIDDTDVRARALDVLGTVQLARLDLAGAADTFNREVALSAQAKDPITPFYAYLNRSDVYLKTGEKCDYQRSFEPCYQALDRARADLQQALGIVQKLGFPALARQTEQFIGNVETRRGLVRSQEGMTQTLQKTALFHPKKAADVLVTDRFVAPPGAIPPVLDQLYRASKRSEQQLGGFADVAEARTQFTEGLMNEMRGNNDAALASYLKAVDTLDRDRRSLRDEKSRGTFLEDRIGFYYAAVQQLLERRRYNEAFELFERSRSRALADLLASRKLGLARPEEQKLYTELTVLRTQIADSQSRLFELASQPDAVKNGPSIRTLQGQIQGLEDQDRKAVARMTIEAPRLQNLMVSSPRPSRRCRPRCARSTTRWCSTSSSSMPSSSGTSRRTRSPCATCSFHEPS
jgi:tetratricopeptide (TPR) repeat protein